MATKLKNFHVDERVAAGFEAWCEETGVAEQRVVEALMAWALTLDAATYAQIMGLPTAAELDAAATAAEREMDEGPRSAG